MKKQTKIVIGALIVIVLVIVGLAINFPSVLKGTSSGTFAKADKYHKSQMSGKDVQLRSELTSDTAKLKSTLQGLIYFAVFTEDMCLKIDTCMNVFQAQGIKSGDAGYSQLILLKDYSVFIRNNNETLGKTISMLSSFYLSDVTDQSADVEKNLGEFSNYVRLFIEKDSVLESALQGIDTYILGNKLLLERKDELRKLKSIRDQILISGVQMAGMVNDKALCSNLILQATNSLSRIVINAHGPLQYEAQAKVSLESTQSMNLVQSAKGDIQAVGVVYDKASLQFSAVNGLQYSTLTNASSYNAVQVVGVACWGAKEGLQVIASSFDMKQAFGALPMCSQGALQGNLGSLLLSSPVISAGAVINASSALNAINASLGLLSY